MSNTVRVLHVDDDVGFGELTAETLEQEDDRFDVVVATSVGEGLDRLDEAVFDCVVSDYDIPEADGLTFLDAVREEHPQLPFILFTGEGNEAVASDAIAAGATDYIRKRGGTGQHELLANRVRNAVEQYRTERERERTIQRVTDAVMKLDSEWRVRFVDERAQQLFGMGESDLLDRNVWEVFPDSRGTRFEEEYRQVMDQREPTSFEAESSVFDTWFHVEAYPDDDGGLSIYFRDVTDRKESERELRRLKQEYQNVFEHASDSLFLVDVEGTPEDPSFRIRQINPANEAAIGLPNEVVRGRTHYELFDEEVARRATARYEECVATGETISYEEELPVEGGTHVFETTLSPVEVDGEVTQVVGVAHDITERKNRERELEAARERMEFALDATDSIIYEIDLDTHEQTRHGPFEEIFGLPSETVSQSGEFYRRAVHPDDRQDLKRRQRRVARVPDVGSTDGEYRTHPDNGPVRWVRSMAYVRPGDETAPRKLVGLATDITERKEHEREIARERDRYATLFENLPNPVVYGVAKNGDPIVRRVNPAFEELFGYAADEIEGKPLHDFVLPDGQRDEARQLSREILRDQRMQTEVRRDTANGPRTFRLDVAMRNPEGNSSEGYAIYTDITERERHERQLSRLHETTRDLVHAESSERVAEIASAAADDILNLPLNGVHFYDEEAGGLVPVGMTDSAMELFGDPPVLDDGVAWNAYRDGEVRVYGDVREADEVYNPDTPIRSEMYLPIGDHGIFLISSPEVDDFDDTDVALAKTLAANVESTLDRMERERELERKTERLDEFASVVSHDLRNPLNTLKLSLDLAAESDDPAPFERCLRATDRMERLVNDLLTLARQGDTVSGTEPVDTADIVTDCWRTVNPTHADLTVETSGVILADRGRLEQLFENLIHNAAEHGGRGVTVTVGTMEGGFYVADDGPGVPDDEREQIFENGYSTSEEGTGFGLAIVERIADAHGWTVAVTESAGGGARFEITGVATDETAGDATPPLDN